MMMQTQPQTQTQSRILPIGNMTAKELLSRVVRARSHGLAMMSPGHVNLVSAVVVAARRCPPYAGTGIPDT